MLARISVVVNSSSLRCVRLGWLPLLVLPLLPACTRVTAYQRERLAHPTMTPTFGESDALTHVRAVQEGAIGGELGASSGCGCN
ncbi:MAG: DUF4266 domain-containing protein [Polyangiaceae bacterium]|nr:DUF4266 domain-containing protein [Polyangiaceae bacterium]